MSGVQKFQRVFGIVLIILSLIIIIFSAMGIKKSLQIININGYHSNGNFSAESNQIIRMEFMNLGVNSQALKINLDLSLLLISLMSLLIGILFYTEGKKE